ncbi:unnamed protein product, partial [Prorocentrum cordatum]
AWKKQKLDAAKGPVEKPLERQANEALQQVRIFEKRPNRELNNLEKAKKWPADYATAAADAQAELDAQDNIRDVLDGKPDAILLTDGDGLLALGDTDYELSASDREESRKRRAELQSGLPTLAKELFSSMAASIDMVRADHAERRKRPAAKKRKEPARAIQPTAQMGQAWKRMATALLMVDREPLTPLLRQRPPSLTFVSGLVPHS